MLSLAALVFCFFNDVLKDVAILRSLIHWFQVGCPCPEFDLRLLRMIRVTRRQTKMVSAIPGPVVNV